MIKSWDAGASEEIQMELTKQQGSEQEMYRAQVAGEELAERIARAVREDGTAAPMEGLQLRRASAPTELGHGVSSPTFCVVAQGSKEVLLGENRFHYDPAHYLIATATLPIASRIIEASPEKPY